MKKLFVTGANGLLGSKIVEAAKKRYKVTATDIQASLQADLPDVEYVQADLSDPQSAEIFLAINPDVVIHAAAYTNVDGCETDRESAYKVNVTGTEIIAKFCRDKNCTMVYVSTDYVFDGKQGPYTEEDPPNPISYYGETKYLGELKASSIVPELIIARTAVLFGYYHGQKKNFITWLIEELNYGREVRIVSDQYNTPTLADELAEACILLYEKGKRGVFHTAGSEFLTRYDFSIKTAEVFGFDKNLIKEISTSMLNQKAKRPMIGGLKNHKVKSEINFMFSNAEDALMKVKNQVEKDGFNLS